MRILIFGSNFLKLLSSVLDFDENEVVLLVDDNFEEFSVNNYFGSNVKTKILYFKNMIDVDMAEFEKVDLFISASEDDKSIKRKELSIQSVFTVSL